MVNLLLSFQRSRVRYLIDRFDRVSKILKSNGVTFYLPHVEVGMGRAGTGPREDRFVVRYVGCPVTVKKFYFSPAPVQARVSGPWAKHPFPFF